MTFSHAAWYKILDSIIYILLIHEFKGPLPCDMIIVRKKIMNAETVIVM